MPETTQFNEHLESRTLDFRVKDEGTIWLFSALTPVAEEWVEEHVLTAQWWGDAFVVEHRYGPPLLEALINEDFEVDYVH